MATSVTNWFMVFQCCKTCVIGLFYRNLSHSMVVASFDQSGVSTDKTKH